MEVACAWMLCDHFSCCVLWFGPFFSGCMFYFWKFTKHTQLFRTVNLKMVKMVNLTLYIFPLHTIFKNVIKEFASSWKIWVTKSNPALKNFKYCQFFSVSSLGRNKVVEGRERKEGNGEEVGKRRGGGGKPGRRGARAGKVKEEDFTWCNLIIRVTFDFEAVFPRQVRGTACAPSFSPPLRTLSRPLGCSATPSPSPAPPPQALRVRVREPWTGERKRRAPLPWGRGSASWVGGGGSVASPLSDVAPRFAKCKW